MKVLVTNWLKRRWGCNQNAELTLYADLYGGVQRMNVRLIVKRTADKKVLEIEFSDADSFREFAEAISDIKNGHSYRK